MAAAHWLPDWMNIAKTEYIITKTKKARARQSAPALPRGPHAIAIAKITRSVGRMEPRKFGEGSNNIHMREVLWPRTRPSPKAAAAAVEVVLKWWRLQERQGLDRETNPNPNDKQRCGDTVDVGGETTPPSQGQRVTLRGGRHPRGTEDGAAAKQSKEGRADEQRLTARGSSASYAAAAAMNKDKNDRRANEDKFGGGPNECDCRSGPSGPVASVAVRFAMIRKLHGNVQIGPLIRKVHGSPNRVAIKDAEGNATQPPLGVVEAEGSPVQVGFGKEVELESGDHSAGGRDEREGPDVGERINGDEDLNEGGGRGRGTWWRLEGAV
ncbi:hypothetical protein C8R46DRAFT_1028272 [Mycena filopes]|nr:hypothetical protein C8R46DRAFT_1028272 [Mycena filopes]